MSIGGSGRSVVAVRKHFKAKVCLVGDAAVGKTSLVHRYVRETFDERYLLTLGTRVTKKSLVILDPASHLDEDLDLIIWDVMGQPGFRELLRDAYFYDAKGVLAVADLTRPDTIRNLGDWIRSVETTIGTVPAVVAVNKSDLAADDGQAREEAVRAAEAFGADVLMTSAKSGLNVEEAFHRLGVRVLGKILG